jgi:hypothetical protein
MARYFSVTSATDAPGAGDTFAVTTRSWSSAGWAGA